MSSPAWTLAIDFGTSNSAAAHSGATSGGIETLSLSHTSNLMPSSVFVAAPDRIIVGDAAVNHAQQNPAGFVSSPKRLIGGNPTTTVNGFTMPTHSLVAAVMGAIIQRGKAAHAGVPPTQVVLTHPEAWAPQQIRILIDAASVAGVHPSRITTISEPRAAAAHYSRSHALQPGARIAVFDFGGGTLDIAVLSVSAQNTFQVIAARGNNGLGGKNLDALVQRWVEARLEERDPGLVAWLRRQAPMDVVQSLQDSIRRGKELLSEAPSATITVPTPSGRIPLQITRDEFDELIAPAVVEAMQLTTATLLDVGITNARQLTALYLTGGSSRIPLIQQKLGELGPVATLDDPKTVVAQGALLVARTESAPSTAERAAIPGAGDLMPSWHGQGSQTPGRGQPTAPREPQSGPPAYGGPVAAPEFAQPPGAAGGGGRRWGRIAAAVVAVVAVVGIAAGAVALMNRDDGSPDAEPTAGATSSAPAETGKDGGMIVTDKDQVIATMPVQLQNSVTQCRNAGEKTNGALEVICGFTDDGPLADLGTEGAMNYFISAHVDANEAKSNILNIRDGVYSAGEGTLVEDAARQAAGEISSQSGTADGDYKISYANQSTGMVITVFGIKSIDDGKAFLTRSGLIS
ncbi:Hsp70 family protein [Gordonia insulae]|uniref:Chaperone protein HscA n=1 Tax=Gordonia insulae TaxID=2420509 RepID=A0A3G8JRR4_9ACTN|nr:Hsp70 family protein [Gordonia insulae]AZG46870.1 Chaperone protein HscA [Gordonia insulae]